MRRSLIVLGMLGAAATAAPATADPLGALALTATPPESMTCNSEFVVTGSVTAGGAAGVPRQSVRFSAADAEVGFATTELDGTYAAAITIDRPGPVTLVGTTVLDTTVSVEIDVDGFYGYPDEDGDGFGSEAAAECVSSLPTGWITTGGDCEDANAGANPAAEEVLQPELPPAERTDENCDGIAE